MPAPTRGSAERTPGRDDEVLDFAALTLDRALTVRFIEYMPTAGGQAWRELLLPANRVLAKPMKRYRLRPVDKESLGGPARYFRIDGAAGAIGLITPLSCRFCSDCNRIRVAADGVAKSCLFAQDGTDLKPFLRRPNRRALEEALVRLVGGKPRGHMLAAGAAVGADVLMSRVGG